MQIKQKEKFSLFNLAPIYMLKNNKPRLLHFVINLDKLNNYKHYFLFFFLNLFVQSKRKEKYFSFTVW